MGDIAQCPFCGNQDAVELQKTTNGMMRVHCDNCGSSGYETDERDTAIRSWNRRALPLEPTPVRVAEDVLEAIDDALSSWSVEAETDLHNGWATQQVVDERDARAKLVRTWLESQRPQEPPRAE